MSRRTLDERERIVKTVSGGERINSNQISGEVRDISTDTQLLGKTNDDPKALSNAEAGRNFGYK